MTKKSTLLRRHDHLIPMLITQNKDTHHSQRLNLYPPTTRDLKQPTGVNSLTWDIVRCKHTFTHCYEYFSRPVSKTKPYFGLNCKQVLHLPKTLFNNKQINTSTSSL